MKMTPEEIGSRIKEARKNKKMTQADLAEKLFVSDKAVSKWERGICFPDLSLLIPLAEELDISLYELLKGEKIEENKIDETLKEAIILSNNEIKKNKKNLSAIFMTIIIAILIVLLPIIAILNNHKEKLELQAMIEEDNRYTMYTISDYLDDKTNLTTHDGSHIEAILSKLPLYYPNREFDLNDFEITFKYNIDYEEIVQVYGGEDNVKPKMIYSTLVLYTTVDDLEFVSFHFKDRTYTAFQDDVIRVLALEGFEEIKDDEEWNSLVELFMEYFEDVFKNMFH